jgi:hypothetical protein
MPGLELHRVAAMIGDGDGVGPEKIIVFRRRAIGDEPRRHHDFDIAGQSAIHAANLDVISTLSQAYWRRATAAPALLADIRIGALD